MRRKKSTVEAEYKIEKVEEAKRRRRNGGMECKCEDDEDAPNILIWVLSRCGMALRAYDCGAAMPEMEGEYTEHRATKAL